MPTRGFRLQTQEPVCLRRWNQRFFSRQFEGRIAMQFFLALTERLFCERYHTTSCPRHIWATTIARIGSRNQDQLLPWRAVKIVKPKGLAKHAVASLDQACLRPTGEVPVGELSHPAANSHRWKIEETPAEPFKRLCRAHLSARGALAVSTVLAAVKLVHESWELQ